jgi:hypothetical protein
MAVVEVENIQTWLAPKKFQITELEEDLELQQRSLVFAMIANTFDVTGWVTPASTPVMVKQAVSMLYASWVWRRVVAEQHLDNDSYADKLESMAMMLITGIIGGTVELVEVEGVASDGVGPLFYPTDFQDDDPDNSRRFTMGQVF